MKDELRRPMIRLVKEMTGKDATAAAIGLTDTTLPQSGIVTRQELAAYVHRTLMYIERNSDLAYSEYEPKLSKYADNAQVEEWAKEPMGFCDVFELIDPKNATTLAPNETCSIEQALVTAERATMAIPNFCAFSNLLGPMLSPAKIKLVFEEMLPTFFPPCFSMNALYSSRE